MFRFGFKKKWKSNRESKEPEQPPTLNGIKLLNYRNIDNEFAPRAPAPQTDLARSTSRVPRVKRNALAVFRQSYPNYPAQKPENNSQEQVHFETIQHRTVIPDANYSNSQGHFETVTPESNYLNSQEHFETVQHRTDVPDANDLSQATFSPEGEEKSTLIFMTEDHEDIVLRRDLETESDTGDFEVNLGTAFEQRRLEFGEAVPSEEQEQELEDIYGARNVHVQNVVDETSNSDNNSIDDRETVDLYNGTNELDQDNFRVHVMQHANDAMSMVSYQSGDTLLDNASVLQDENRTFRFDDHYNFGESHTEEMDQNEDDDNPEIELNPEINKIEEDDDDDTNAAINIANEPDDTRFIAEETIENIQVDQIDVNDVEEKIIPEKVEKRVMFDVSNIEEKPNKRKIKPEIIPTPPRKETLEDVQMKKGYSVQASALFFKATKDDDGNESETSA